MGAWTESDIPDQAGRVAIVTGANTGIGLETARMLAEHGAHVVLACRNEEKGRAAVASIDARGPRGEAELRLLDLGDLDSVAAFAASFAADFTRLDLLIHNAGVMVPPFSRTKQGFELQLGTNHLGHFALGGRLLPLLRATAGSRVVVVYSGAHHFGTIDLDDPNYERKAYNAERAYAQSKLANVLYAVELQRRLGASDPIVTAAHPGWTQTDLQRTSLVARVFNPLFGMQPPAGALPTVRAATDPGAGPGTFWGPSRLWEMNGPPEPGRIANKGRDLEVAGRLWALSEQLTGVSYGLPA